MCTTFKADVYVHRIQTIHLMWICQAGLSFVSMWDLPQKNVGMSLSPAVGAHLCYVWVLILKNKWYIGSNIKKIKVLSTKTVHCTVNYYLWTSQMCCNTLITIIITKQSKPWGLDVEEDHRGWGCHLGQGLTNMHTIRFFCLSWFASLESGPPV